MSTALIRVALVMVAFAILDGLWLGLLMNRFYRTRLAPIARLADGGFAPNWTAALLVYLALGVGIAFLVIPRAGTLGSAVGWGALFGFVTYGVYDFTNMATLKDWSWTVSLVDVLWGGFACATASGVVWTLTR